VQELRLNGRPYEKTWIPYAAIERGGVLDFTLGPEPNKQWANGPAAAPPSFDEGMQKGSHVTH
jgi:putative alpha-1,2-mannosidase